MATITAVTSSVQGERLNVLDPATWVGGVVPGKGDTAVLPHTPTTNYRDQGSTIPSSGGYIHPILAPWSGSSITKDGNVRNVRIRLFSAAAIPFRDNGGANSGSVYARLHGRNNMSNQIKIDYEYRSGDYLYSCSIDESYRKWLNGKSSGWNENSYEAIGRFYYNNTAFMTNNHQYELTGSGEWYVDHIDMGNYTQLRVKDDAKIVLTGTTPRIDLTYAAQQTVEFLDQATLEISSSGNTSNGRDGIDAYNESGVTIILSGSANYSSSFVSESVSAGSVQLRVSDSTAFAEGDIISIQSTASFQHHRNDNNPQINYSYQDVARQHITASSEADRFMPTSSWSNVSIDSEVGTPTSYVVTSGFVPDISKDELARVVTGSNDTLTIAKFFTRRGTIESDLGAYAQQAFTETFNIPVKNYSGNYRVVLVDSVHNNYKRGESLIINKKAYNIHAIGSYLTQSMFIDFTAGADPRDHFVWSPNENSGSGYTSAQSSYSQTYYYWDEVYRKGTLWASGSIKGGPSCFFFTTASLKSYNEPANNNRYETYAVHNVMLSGSYWNEGEIEVSASISDTLINDLDVTSGVGINWPSSPFTRVSSYSGDTQGRLATQNSVDTGPMQFGIEPYYGMYLRAADSLEYGSIIPFRNYTGSADGTFNYPHISNFDLRSQTFTDAGFRFNATGSNGSFSIKFKRTKNHNEYFYRDADGETLVFENWTDSQKDAIKILIQQMAKVYSISVKSRYQLLLLDTEDSFERLDEVLDGGLINAHPADKPVKWVATEIEDALGYKNKLWDWYDKKGKTSILPYRQGFTRTSAAYDMAYIRERYGSHNTFRQHEMAAGHYFSYDWDNVNGETTIDFGAPVTFNRIGIGVAGSSQYIEGTRDTVQYGAANFLQDLAIQYSTDDTTNENAFTDWRPVADDTRVSSGLTALRFYTGSMVTAQVIKIKGGDGTRIGADKFFIGAYSGSASSPDIKLKNVNNFKVGDCLVFWSQQKPNGSYFLPSQYAAQSAIYPTFIPSYNSGDYYTDVEPTVNGGFRIWYEIKAINGNVVTLDRDPVHLHLDKGTLVYKANRGNVTLKVNHLGKNYGGCNVYSNYSNCFWKFQNAWIWGSLYTIGSTTYVPTFAYAEDVVATPSYTRKAALGAFYDPSNYVMRNALGFGFLAGYKRQAALEMAPTTFYNILHMGGGDGTQYQYRSQSPSVANINFCMALNTENFGFPYYASRIAGNYSSAPLQIQKQMNTYTEAEYNYHGAHRANNNSGPFNLQELDVNENHYGRWRYGARIFNTTNGYYGNTKTFAKLYLGWKAHHNSGLHLIHPQASSRYNGQYGYSAGTLSTNLGLLMLAHPFYDRKNIMYHNEDGARTGTNGTVLIEESKNNYAILNTTGGGMGYQYNNWFTWKRCIFKTTEAVEGRIQLNFEYKWNRHYMLSIDEYQELGATSYQIPNYSSGYNTRTSGIPHLTVVKYNREFPAGRTIDSKPLLSDCDTYTTLDYNKAFTFEADSTYEVNIVFERNRNYNAPRVLGRYKPITFNITSTAQDKISVIHSSYNIERAFNNINELSLANEGTPSQGADSVFRLTNDTTSKVKFNKIKL